MAPPTYEQAWRTGRDGPAFSNGTEFDVWMSAHCADCLNDQRIDETGGCPLILVAWDGRIPIEWEEDRPLTLGRQYRCLMRRTRDDGPDTEPQPIPGPPGQLVLFPREPYERPGRMLKPLPEPQQVVMTGLREDDR